MKRILCILAILALCTISLPALAVGSVTATGSATVSIVPDMATFSVGITTQNALITTAQAANTEAMQSVIDALLALDIERDDLQTDRYSVSPVYDYESDFPTITGYEVSNTITVIVRTLDRLPSLLDAAVEAGANTVYSLNFQSSEEAAAYEQALKAAAQDALRKAALMAQTIGREAGDALELSEVSYGNTYNSYDMAFSRELSSVMPIENGQIEISAQVQAVIELK